MAYWKTVCEQSKEIDKKRAEAALGRAKKRVKDKNHDIKRAEQALLKAKNRLKIDLKLT